MLSSQGRPHTAMYSSSCERNHQPKFSQSRTTKNSLLILEDFDELRGLFAKHFANRGYDIFSSATLRGALAIAYEEAPQVIIIDHDLSGETASHAIERLRIALPKSYIVVVGEPNSVSAREITLNAGASRVLSNACDLTEIDEIIAEAPR